jgi:ATP-dependent RNA circularization protein (DNA/RNA ligase family)
LGAGFPVILKNLPGHLAGHLRIGLIDPFILQKLRSLLEGMKIFQDKLFL